MYFQLLLHSSNEVMCSTVCCFLLSNPMSVLKWGMGGSRKALCIAVTFGLQRTLMQIHEYYQEPKLNYQGFIIISWEYLGEWGDKGTTSGNDEVLSSHKGLAT